MTTEPPPEAALNPDLPAIAAFASHHHYGDMSVALAAWHLGPEDERAGWRATADAAIMTASFAAGAERDRLRAQVEALTASLEAMRRASGEASPDPKIGTVRHIPTGATWAVRGENRQPPWEQVAVALGRQWRAVAAERDDRNAKDDGDHAEIQTLRECARQLDAAIADAVSPTARDYDHAAEITRLRDASEADIASLTDQRNRVSDTADQLRAQVRHLRDALERCRDAAGGSPAAVHTIASQALASNPAPASQAALRMILGRCPVYPGTVHAQIGDDGEWFCLRDLADTAEGAARDLVAPRPTADGGAAVMLADEIRAGAYAEGGSGGFGPDEPRYVTADTDEGYEGLRAVRPEDEP